MNRLTVWSIGVALLLVAVSGCTTETVLPMDLLPDQTGCQLSIGDSADTAVVDPNEYGPLRPGNNEIRSTGPNEFESYWEAEAMVAGGMLTVRMDQPTVGSETQAWPIADISAEGVVMSGPWGGPYEDGGPGGSMFFFTCWTNPVE